MIRRPPRSPLFPYTPLFRSLGCRGGPAMSTYVAGAELLSVFVLEKVLPRATVVPWRAAQAPHVVGLKRVTQDRKSTRLNSSHANISYAVFCLKKKKINDDAL